MTDDQPASGSDRGNMFQLAAHLLRWRKFIIVNTLAVAVLSALISLLLPKWYRSVSSVIPPKDQGFASLLGLNSPFRSLPLTGRLTGLNSSMGAYNFLAILSSRTVAEAVIRKFNLIEVYDVSDTSMDLAIEELMSNVTIDVKEDENTISIEVLDKDRVRAAEMANYFVEMLNRVSLELATLEARNNKEFVGTRVGQAKADLTAAEDALRAYQEKKGVVISPDFSTSSLEAVAELYGMRARKEVELGILEKTVSGESDVIRSLRLELSELDKKLSVIPEIGLSSYRLYREVAIQQKILEYLIPLYEQARIEEQKDVPVILVLDRAVPAEKKFKPKRMLIVAGATGLGLLVSMLIVFGSSYVETLRRSNVADYDALRKRMIDAGLGRFTGKG